ncbi:hypothetical protein C7974DRAFT_396966 [Boeremia exigua]|uniref:uncharacterized protein n=1 Tax=Boeremia exigua TaxID=749465 RepID=UPI001E8E1CB4|nr:uncharacterized protein C7974DRAFT_396966 [Boeremia exigua]KAH6625921.1 hypothetical protein C7974DRAFT_396966 [Boeremia exigua]
MTKNTGDAFGRLPEELRIKIIKLTPDSLSLRSLAHASPAMGRVLDRYPLKIVEVILNASIPLATCRIIYAVYKGRFSRFPASLSEAQKVAEIDSTKVDEMHSSRLDQAAAVRSLLATIENVHAWSHACLEHLIEKSMELRPSTLIKNGAGRTSREEFEKAESRKDYLPQYTGPPLWVEEQRMIKAFWRLQFLLELQDAGNNGRLGTYWSGQEVDMLFGSSPDGFYDVSGFEREQILTACDFLGAVTSRTIPSVEAVHDNARSLPAIHWVERAVPRCTCAEPPFFELNKDAFSQGPDNLNRAPWSYHFHHAMSTTDGWLDGCPLTLVYPFRHWRKYGFAIWDEKRMADLGMRHPKRRAIGSNSLPYSFRWWSILTTEDLRED